MNWRIFVVSTVETIRFLWTTRKYRNEPMQVEREFAVYVWRCDWKDFTAPVRPHARCWICGDYVRRWWRRVPDRCDCP